jgi:hypothetical protein
MPRRGSSELKPTPRASRSDGMLHPDDWRLQTSWGPVSPFVTSIRPRRMFFRPSSRSCNGSLACGRRAVRPQPRSFSSWCQAVIRLDESLMRRKSHEMSAARKRCVCLAFSLSEPLPVMFPFHLVLAQALSACVGRDFARWGGVDASLIAADASRRSSTSSLAREDSPMNLATSPTASRNTDLPIRPSAAHSIAVIR